MYDMTKDPEIPIVYVVRATRTSDKFIKGPLPFTWFERAAACSPTAVKVGLLLFYLHGLKRKTLSLSNEMAKRFHISRNSKRNALCSLEAGGLVKLRTCGQRVVITLCQTSQGIDPVDPNPVSRPPIS
jgi:hypothetical protein